MKLEKLDFVKLRKEMYPTIPQIPLDQDIINEIVAREINLIESKINEIIEKLGSQG